jgi:hypothetical protein
VTRQPKQQLSGAVLLVALSSVAKWFEVPLAAVQATVAFEGSLAA